MAKGRNIIYDDQKRDIRNKLFMILLIVFVISLLGFIVYFFAFGNNNSNVDKNYIDSRFDLLTLKSIETFENPTYSLNRYLEDDTYFGYFYKQEKLTFESLNNEIKIISTIDKMLDCVKVNEGKDACGIEVTFNGYSVHKDEVIKYAKLIYGNKVSIMHQSVKYPYGSIDDLKYFDNHYNFVQNKVDLSNSTSTYLSLVEKVDNLDNQIILTKKVIYIDEFRINGLIKGYFAYGSHEKKDSLFSNESNINNYNEMITDAKKQMNSVEVPKYKITFSKNNDGSFVFNQIEPIK